ncbi:MAG: hypothetical protein R6V01_09490 [Thermoplasmatota archaeon]
MLAECYSANVRGTEVPQISSSYYQGALKVEYQRRCYVPVQVLIASIKAVSILITLPFIARRREEVIS